MPVYVGNPADWLKIAIVAFIAVKAVNYGLDKLGQPQFKV